MSLLLDTALLAAAPLVPAAAAVLALLRRGRPPARDLAWSTPLPALGLALRGPEGALEAGWALFGTELLLVPWTRLLLLLTAVAWLAVMLASRAALAGDVRRERLQAPLLAALTGNVLVVLAGDAVTFYVGFAALTYASYPLIAHARDATAVRAARIYLVYAVAGESLLLGGLVLAVGSAGTTDLAAVSTAVAASPARGVTVALLLAGFGIKAGIAGLHGWLPIAHPAAPTPASAVLSGCLIKAGLLGWLHFLPLGADTAGVPPAATACLVLGLTGAFGGALAGVAQRDPKTLLAYSSVSQIGVLLLFVGVGLAAPAEAPVARTGAALFALHHGVAKAALFLGVGLVHAEGRRWVRRSVLVGQGIAGAALAGAPFTSGMAAKGVLKDLVPALPGPWADAFDVLVPLTSAATALLLSRLLLLERRATAPDPAAPANMLAGWAGLLVLVALLPWALPAGWLAPVGLVDPLEGGAVLDAGWPLALGLTGAWGLARTGGWPSVPPGDAVVVAERVARSSARRRATGGRASRSTRATPPAWRVAGGRRVAWALRRTGGAADALEARLVRWRTAGALAGVVLAALAAALVYGTASF